MRILSVFACALLFVGCATQYSLVEKSIRSNVPEPFKSHASGPIADPTQTQVQEAIDLGKASKERPEILEYAYLTKASTSAVATDSLFIQVTTPLRLIAEESAKRARDYRPINQATVEQLRTLRAVKISLIQQYQVGVFQAFPVPRHVILLRDGARVEPLRQVASVGGGNPFGPAFPLLDTSNAQVQAIANSYARATFDKMTPEQKQQSAEMLRSQGYSAEQISAMTGIAVAAEEQPKAAAPVPYSLTEFDGVFAIEDLLKPGAYEVIFREPRATLAGGVKEREIRIPISFAAFR